MLNFTSPLSSAFFHSGGSINYVSLGAKAVREFRLVFDPASKMEADAIDDLFFPKEKRVANDAYLRPDMEALVERKKNRKLPVKLFWLEHCGEAQSAGRPAYSYQLFARTFSELAEKMDATCCFSREPGAKAFIDWALPVKIDKAQSTSIERPALCSM